MSLRQVSAYALRTRPLGEADLIVELFSRERGRVRGVAKSARRIKSRFGSCFEPFTLSRIVYFQRDKDGLGRISSCDIERSWFETLTGLEQAVCASYLAELIIGFAPEQDPSPRLFRLIGACLAGLGTPISPDLVARYGELWILRLSGLLPDPVTCGSCGRALVGEAWVSEMSLELQCGRECGGSVARRRLPAGARKLMLAMLRNTPQVVAQQGCDGRELRALGAVLETLVCGHLDRAPKSLRVMRQINRLAPPA